MTISAAQRRAVAKYNAENYDRIEVRVPKGKKKLLKDFTERTGETVNGFINRAIDECLGREEKCESQE